MACLAALGRFQQIKELETHKLFVNCSSVEQFHWKNSKFSGSRTVAHGLQLFNRTVYSYLEYSWMKNQENSEN